MTKNEIKQRIKGLNEYMLSDSSKQLLLLNISSDYTYNKGIAIIDKNKSKEQKDWYSVDKKNCFKTWNEAEAFLDGLCLAKNINFNDKNEQER